MPSRPFAASVVVVSGAALADPAENRTGPLAEGLLVELGARVTTRVVDDQVAAVQQALREAVSSGSRLVLTCGGTGLRDEEVTVEATGPLLQRRLPGIGEEIRRRGATNTPLALLSRGLAGTMRDEQGRSALVVNAPGSRGGVRDAVAVLAPLLGHLLDDLDGAPRA